MALTVLVWPASLSFAKGMHKKADALQDQIEVLAHLRLSGGRVEQLLTARHYGRDYLYAQYASGMAVTLLHVTDAAHPAILSDLSLPHPTIQRESHNVSTVARDDGRGLIFLARADGLWIL
jgi:hypothetical protein